MGVEWVMYLQSQIFTRIKNEFSEKLKTKYKMTASNFSTVGSSDTPAVFPFVYIEELESPEIGRSTEGNEINGLRYGIQVLVSDNTKQNNAKEVSFEVFRILKNMGFNCNKPIPTNNTKDIHTYGFRATKAIGENAIL